MPLQPYTGIVVLDNNHNRSYLQQQDGDGVLQQYLLLLDRAAEGGFDWPRVSAAWQYYSSIPGIQSEVSQISFEGFWEYASDGVTVILHVVNT